MWTHFYLCQSRHHKNDQNSSQQSLKASAPLHLCRGSASLFWQPWCMWRMVLHVWLLPVLTAMLVDSLWYTKTIICCIIVSHPPPTYFFGTCVTGHYCKFCALYVPMLLIYMLICYSVNCKTAKRCPSEGLETRLHVWIASCHSLWLTTKHWISSTQLRQFVFQTVIITVVWQR